MLFPMMMLPSYRDLHTVTLRRSWKGITCIGCFMAGNISLNNASLVHMTLSLNQVIRASIPVITALMAICVEARWPSRLQAGGLLPISMGVMLAVYDASSHASLLGLSLGLTEPVISSTPYILFKSYPPRVRDGPRPSLHTNPPAAPPGQLLCQLLWPGWPRGAGGLFTPRGASLSTPVRFYSSRFFYWASSQSRGRRET
mmetsp:Transcript_57942/g.183906  ORF Transcript_57942/g.183906 Transcript_57942/m.183906 type:complete len:200 (+) Transcript_57942:568-1167(+)